MGGTVSWRACSSSASTWAARSPTSPPSTRPRDAWSSPRCRPSRATRRRRYWRDSGRSGTRAADGSVLVPLDAASVERALDGALGAGAEAIAVCLLHAYLNPAHERLIADIVKSRAPGLPVSCSADVVPEYREFERFSTTVLNAYLQPLMDQYLES